MLIDCIVPSIVKEKGSEEPFPFAQRRTILQRWTRSLTILPLTRLVTVSHLQTRCGRAKRRSGRY